MAMKIGELSARTGVPIETIRFYEAQALLQPAGRAANNYRSYSVDHENRMAFILRCRSLDMTLEEIRVLLRLQDEPAKACTDVKLMLEAHGLKVNARISELQALKSQIAEIAASCAHGGCIGECGALDSLRRTTGASSQSPAKPKALAKACFD